MEAQYQAVKDFLNCYGGEVIAEFVEVESGTRSDRPQFEAAVILNWIWFVTGIPVLHGNVGEKKLRHGIRG